MKAAAIVRDDRAPTHPQPVGQTPRAVYTPEQTCKALEYITAKADTLRGLLIYLAQEVEDSHDQHELHACEALAEMIGAAADTALDGKCVGGFEQRLYGHDFGKAGAA